MSVVVTQAARAAQEREARVTTLQAAVRGWLVRRAQAPVLRAARERKLRQREALGSLVTLLQAYARGWLVRQALAQSLQQQRERRARLWRGVLWAQAHIRGMLARRECRGKLEALRARRIELQKLQAIAVPLQANCRGYLVRLACREKLEKLKKWRLRLEGGVVRFQAHSRGYIIRTEYSPKLMERRKEREQQLCSTSSPTSTHQSISATSAACSTSSITATPSKTIAIASTSACSTSSITATPSKTGSPLRTNAIATTTACSTSSITATAGRTDSPIRTSATAGRTDSPIRPCSAISTVASASCTVATTTSMAYSSPTGSPKRKLTMERRLQSSLKALNSSVFDTSDAIDTASITSRSTRYYNSDLRTCSSPSVLSAASERVFGGKEWDRSSLEEVSVEEAGVAAEAKALQEVVRSREEELAVAQLARERMSAIFSAEEIQLMAERQRKRGSYQLELESACSPLLPVAWLGLVEERMDWWKNTRTTSRTLKHRPAEQSHSHSPMENQPAGPTKGSGRQPISKAQMLAASRRGCKLKEVVQVVLYRTRHLLDLSSLQHCPNLRTLTLSNCGLEVMTGLPAQDCPLLVELTAQVCMYYSIQR